MALRYTDFNGHEVVDLNGTALIAGTTGTTTVGTAAPLAAGAGVGSTVTAVNANDRRGQFVLTTAGTPAAGVAAVVLFAQPYAAVPAAVIVTITNTTDTTSPNSISAASITVAGFSIVSTVLTTAKAYLVQYVVIP